MVAAADPPTTATAQTPASASELHLSGELELARLVELISQRLGVSVQYQALDLGKRITLRLRGPVADAELWTILSSTLESQGLAIVETDARNIFRITPVAQAQAQHAGLLVSDALSGAARVAPESIRQNADEESRAAVEGSYLSAVVRLRSADATETAAAFAPLLTPQTGALKPIGTSGLLFITDVRRRVEQVLSLVELLDGPPDPAALFTVELINASAGDVAALTQQALAAKASADPRSLRPAANATKPMGSALAAAGAGAVQLIALPDDQRVLVAAPASREQELRDLIGSFDRRAPVEMRSYSAPAVAPEDLAASIRALLDSSRLGPSSGAGASGSPRVVVDRLLGAALVTASVKDHERVGALVERIASIPAASRQALRAFTLRNRSASELAGTLERLLAAGALEAAGVVTPSVNASDAPRRLATSQRGVSNAGLFAAPGADVTSSAAAPSHATIPQGMEPGSRAGSGAHPSGSDGDSAAQAAPAGIGLTLAVDEPTNTILAVGDPAILRQLEALISDLDKRQPQVLLEATLVSLSESDALSFGVELRGQFEKGGTTIDLASLFGLGAAGAGGPLAAGTGFTGAVINPGDFQVLVRALENINRGRSVSSPKALVNNNATATLRGVLRQPFTSINASQTVATTSFGGTQDAGTTITVTPAIAEGDHLLLDYSVELSAFVGSPTTTVGGGIIPPPSQQNSVEGQATIPDSFTVVIGGLDNITETRGQSRVPILGSIPILGALFGTTNESDTRSRFFVFLRATILRDAAFADLKQLSGRDRVAAGIGDGMPVLEPLWIE